MSKKSDQHAKHPSQGNGYASFMFFFPVALIIWVAFSHTELPLNQSSYFLRSFAYVFPPFIVLWYMSFRNSQPEKGFIPLSIVLFIIWVAGGFTGIAKINTFFDQSEPVDTYLKVVDLKKYSTKPKSCQVKIEPTINGLEWLNVKFAECDLIDVNKDGLLLSIREGALSMPWKVDHSIVKDIDTYKQRLGIQ